MTKSEVAFRLSAAKFFDEQPKVYFWTFTFKRVHPDWNYAEIWSRFWRSVQDLYGGTLQGLKVAELHDAHGLHFHCLLNTRVWVGQVRRIGKRFGVGRVHVKKADEGSIGYLAKYVAADLRKTGQELHARVSRWQCVGAFKGVRKADIVVTGTKCGENIRFLQEFLGEKQVPFALVQLCKRDPFIERCTLRRVARSMKPRGWKDKEVTTEQAEQYIAAISR